MCASIFGTHVVEVNFELHKLSVVFVVACVPFLLALHKPRLQIGKCYELSHDIKMFLLKHDEKLWLQHINYIN
jgi:hypothetical protein